jgi:homoserine dehydrogenase
MGAQPLRVAQLGCGTVGTEVVRLLRAQSDDLAARIGAPLELVGIGVRDLAADRGPFVPRELLTDDLAGLVSRPEVDVVVETIGGIEPARTLLLQALARGASVVTANKALLAEHGPELYEATDEAGVDLYFEAAVAGAIPLLRPLRESLAGDNVLRVLGIVNGTTNYILTRMSESGASFADALAEAQAMGYAEADPTADVEGYDAAAKAAILAGLAFHTRVTLSDVYREGITAVTAQDVAIAQGMGHVVKLLAICERSADGRGVSVRVHPAMVPLTHPLAGVREVYNAVFVETESAGQLMFYGRGAGGAPTASAVLGDLVAVGRNRLSGGRGPRESAYADLQVRPIGQARTRYYIGIDVADRTGVLATVAQTFAAHGVSIETLRQDMRGDPHGEIQGGQAALVVVTHKASDSALSGVVADLRALDVVQGVASVMRVEGG